MRASQLLSMPSLQTSGAPGVQVQPGAGHPQTNGVPPPPQVAGTVHVKTTSEGQVTLEPVQVSPGSQGPVEGRQTVPAPLTWSTQTPEPLQVSCASHSAAFEEPQGVPASFGVVGEHVIPAPQVSAPLKHGEAGG